MKTKKITQEFLNAIREGYKSFEIRKDDNLEGEVELQVLERHNFIVINNLEICGKCNEWISFNNYYDETCIKSSIKVKLKKNDMSSYKIACVISNNIFMSENDSKEWRFWQKVHSFLMNWTKDNQPLYWYDITHIWHNEQWMTYEDYRNLVKNA